MKHPQNPKLKFLAVSEGITIHSWTHSFRPQNFYCYFFMAFFFFFFLRFYISCFKTRSDHKSCLLNPHPIFCACTWGKEQCCALGVCWQCSCTCMCTHTELCLLVLCSYKQGMLLFGSEGGLLDILQYCQNRHVRDKIVALEGFMLLLRETYPLASGCIRRRYSAYETENGLNTNSSDYFSFSQPEYFLLLFLDFFFLDTIPPGYCYFNKRGEDRLSLLLCGFLGRN